MAVFSVEVPTGALTVGGTTPVVWVNLAPYQVVSVFPDTTLSPGTSELEITIIGVDPEEANLVPYISDLGEALPIIKYTTTSMVVDSSSTTLGGPFLVTFLDSDGFKPLWIDTQTAEVIPDYWGTMLAAWVRDTHMHTHEDATYNGATSYIPHSTGGYVSFNNNTNNVVTFETSGNLTGTPLSSEQYLRLFIGLEIRITDGTIACGLIDSCYHNTYHYGYALIAETDRFVLRVGTATSWRQLEFYYSSLANYDHGSDNWYKLGFYVTGAITSAYVCVDGGDLIWRDAYSGNGSNIDPTNSYDGVLGKVTISNVTYLGHFDIKYMMAMWQGQYDFTDAQVKEWTARPYLLFRPQVTYPTQPNWLTGVQLYMLLNGPGLSHIAFDLKSSNVLEADSFEVTDTIVKFNGSSLLFTNASGNVRHTSSDTVFQWWLATDYVIEGWVYPITTEGTSGAICGESVVTSTELSWQLLVIETDTLALRGRTGSGTYWEVAMSTSEIVFDAWNHILFQWDTATLTAYLGANGVMEALTVPAVPVTTGTSIVAQRFIGGTNNTLGAAFSTFRWLRNEGLWYGTGTTYVEPTEIFPHHTDPL